MSVFQVDDQGELVRDRGFVRIDGIEAVAQDLRVYLRLRRGEVPTRTDLGMPWLQILEQGVTENLLGQVIGEQGVLTRPGIVSQNTTVAIDRVVRRADVTIRASYQRSDQQRRAALVEQVTVLI